MKQILFCMVLLAGIFMLAATPVSGEKDPHLIAQAFGWIEQGMDFADALHLAQSQSADKNQNASVHP